MYVGKGDVMYCPIRVNGPNSSKSYITLHYIIIIIIIIIMIIIM